MVSSPKVAAVRYPDAPPPVPERSDADVASLAESQRSQYFRRGGRAMTMLTGATGADPGSAAVKFLGGAART